MRISCTVVLGWIVSLSLTPCSLAEGGEASLDASDYASIHAAVEALPESGGTVRIPAGTYEILKPIVVEKSEVTIMGEGSGTILRNTSSNGGHTFELRGRRGRGKRIWRVQIANMHLTGNPNSGNAVYAYNVNEISLNDLWVDHHGGSGVFLDECYENARVFDNNIAYNKEYGIFLKGCHDIVVSANQLEENGYGIYAVEVWNAGVTGNSVDDHINHSLYFKQVLGSIVSSNMFENSLDECLVLDEGCNGITVTGNVMRYSGPRLLRITAAKGITVTGNTFESDQGTCLRIDRGSSLVTVSGNVLFGLRENPVRGMHWGIVLDDASEVSVSGNTIVKPFAGGIYASGSSQKHLTITGNTVKNASWKFPGKHSGIHLGNTVESAVNGNIVIDDFATPRMRVGIEEVGQSDFNLISNNQITRGTSGAVQSAGTNTVEEGNQVLKR